MINWLDTLGWTEAHLQELRFTAYTYSKEGKYEDAKIFFDALTVLEPENAYDKRMLGATYILLGDYKTAAAILDEALKIEPEHLGAKLNRAKALLFLGMRAEGLVQAEELSSCTDEEISNDAEALLLAYK